MFNDTIPEDKTAIKMSSSGKNLTQTTLSVSIKIQYNYNDKNFKI